MAGGAGKPAPAALSTRRKLPMDINDIIALKHQWAFLRDAGDIDGMVSLYAPDARTELGPLGQAVGKDAIRANLERMLAGYIPGSRMHELSNPVVHVDGDHASAQWYLRVTAIDSANNQIRTNSLGRYHDDLVRLDEGWRFSVVRLTTLWRYAG